MANIAPDFLSKLKANPNAMVNVIVRLKDNPAQHVADVQASGLGVRHTYSLIPAIAVQGKAAACLDLAKKPWVESIEEDKSVHTM